MNVTEALWLYRELADKHGLEEWTIQLDKRASTRAGVCRYRSKTLGLSKWFIEQAPVAEIRNVILHEIAHALVGPGKGHGPIWKAKAREIGCTGDRCHTVENKARKPRPHWAASCSCGGPHVRSNKPRGTWRCRYTGQILNFQRMVPLFQDARPVQ